MYIMNMLTNEILQTIIDKLWCLLQGDGMPSVPEGPTPPPRKARVRMSGLSAEVPQTMPRQGGQHLS